MSSVPPWAEAWRRKGGAASASVAAAIPPRSVLRSIVMADFLEWLRDGRGRRAGALLKPPAPGGWPARKGRIVAERSGSVQGPVRIHQHFASNRDEVGAPLRHDGLRESGRGDQPDGHGRNANFGADALGIGNLITLRPADHLRGGALTEPSRRAIDRVHAHFLEHARERDRVF